METSTVLKKRLIWIELFVLVLALLFLFPFYLVLTNSFKSMSELLTYTLSLPQQLDFGNYSKAWSKLDLPRALGNTVLITALSNLGLVCFASMAAHRMVRTPSRFNNFLLALFVSSMVVPFQAIMIPLVRVLREVNLIDSIPGVVVTYWGLGMAFTIFLFHGFVKSVPYEIEEAAMIDGCTLFGLYWKMVFPLLAPITVTIVLLNTLWFWNDFLLPNLLLHSPNLETIQMAINSLFGQFMKKWDLALPALVMCTIPTVAFFLFLQRYIIEGISAGGVKG